MRIAIISCPPIKKTHNETVNFLAKGMSAMGHTVDILDAWTSEGTRLPAYDYIAIVTKAKSFFTGKIPENAAKYLSIPSSIAGKKGAAFIEKGGLFTNKALANLMKEMEKQGMIVNWSDILFNPEHAKELGKKIGA
jgi:hypothetical protein